MKTKLNGWQRLWVVLSALSFAVVSIVSVNLWPNSQEIEKDFFNEVYRLIDKNIDPQIRLLSLDRDTSTARVEMPDGRVANFRFSKGASEIEIIKFVTEWWDVFADKMEKIKIPKEEPGLWEEYVDNGEKNKLVPIETGIRRFNLAKKELKSDLLSEANRRGLFQSPKNMKEELLLAEDWLGLAKLAIEEHGQENDFSDVKRTYEMEEKRVNKERRELVLGALLFWLIPIGVLYLLGMSVGWVFKGFKS
jgi:hypothetical protein